MNLKSKLGKSLLYMTTLGLLASCSDSDYERDVEKELNGDAMIARIVLEQSGATTRAVSATPTDEEKAISSSTVYIFDASQILEKIVTFTDNSNTSEEFTISSGRHFFLTVINLPGSTDYLPGFTEGTTTLTNAKATITQLTGMNSIITTKGYFMTSVDDASVYLQPSENANEVTDIPIYVGRAMAKISLTLVGGANGAASLSGPQGDLVDIKFLTANNPRQMYNFPVIESGVYKTPFYSTNSSDEWMTVAKQQASYFPFLDWQDSYTKISGESVDINAAGYLVENSNQKVFRQNASYILVSGQYKPAVWVNEDNVATTASSDGTFYRLYSVDNNEYYDYYIHAASADDIKPNLSKFAAKDVADGKKINVIKYDGGYTYYSFYLKNKNNISPVSEHTVKRNVYYDVTLDQVLSAGSSVPNITGNAGTDQPGTLDPDEYIPGTGGGQGGGNNSGNGGGTDPIEGNSAMTGTITILDWSVVEQSGNIGN